ncbi:TolC family protein [Flavimarina sp. Hel_I_48]|uniref:TolC family protein n=1 Tax=Flavimarina sp. Hel_I_48 TaxID=1392488 RepID=UPI00068D3EF5|nr:efflux transporter outer membrane subunit [Flavimarina sp. Hel_I_48]
MKNNVDSNTSIAHKLVKTYFPLRIVILSGLISLVVSCKVGEAYERPTFKGISSEYFVNDDLITEPEVADSTTMSSIPWKKYIKDTLLTKLIDSALVNNIALQKARQNTNIGMEELQQSKANFYPSLNATPAGYNREYYSENYNNYGSNRARRNHGENVPTSLYTERLAYTSALQSNWEIDLWGKLRWKKEAARAEFMKTQAFKNALQTGIVAEVSSTYFNLLMLRSQIEVAEKNFALNDSTLTIVRLQYDAGETTSLAVQQTNSQRLRAKSLIPQLEREYTIMENKLNTLLGRSPRHLQIERTLEETEFQHQYASGVPLELIKNRPDVALSELDLIATNARVGVAEALKYPSLSIDGTAGFDSFILKNVFDPLTSGFALINASLFQPIFNNRKIKTEYRVSLAQREIAQLDFKKSLIAAIEDVSNAMASIEKLKEQFEIAQERTAVTRKGLKDAGQLFRGGYANYLEVITAQTDALESELDLIRAKKQILVAKIELYRSLGGGWK